MQEVKFATLQRRKRKAAGEARLGLIDVSLGLCDFGFVVGETEEEAVYSVATMPGTAEVVQATVEQAAVERAAVGQTMAEMLPCGN